VISAQQLVAQWRTVMDLSKHAWSCHPVSACRKCKTSKHSFSNEACVWWWLFAAYSDVWSTRFKQGRSSAKDLGRPGRQPCIRDPDNNVKVVQMVLCDHHVMVQHISTEYACHVIMQVLVYWKVSALWVLNSLNEKQKATRMGVCLEHLLQYGNERGEFLDCIVRGDESWCLHCDTENKRVDQQWKDRRLHN